MWGFGQATTRCSPPVVSRIGHAPSPLSSALGRDMNGEVIGAKLLLWLKPTKADYAGKQGLVRGFVLDNSLKSISASTAIRDMLLHDPAAGDPRYTPLSRNPSTGGEITYETFQTALATRGFSRTRRGSHALGIGGTTALANAQSGEEMVAGWIGGWASESQRVYMSSRNRAPIWQRGRLDRVLARCGRRATDCGDGLQQESQIEDRHTYGKGYGRAVDWPSSARYTVALRVHRAQRQHYSRWMTRAQPYSRTVPHVLVPGMLRGLRELPYSPAFFIAMPAMALARKPHKSEFNRNCKVHSCPFIPLAQRSCVHRQYPL